MRRDGRGLLAAAGFWLLVTAFVALLATRARAATADVMPAAGTALDHRPQAEATPLVPLPPARVDALAGARSPVADEIWDRFRGQIVVSDVMIAPASEFPSGERMAAALHRLSRSTVEGTTGFWRVHAMAFLDPVPQGGAALQMRATDVTDPRARKDVRVFELTFAPGDKELALNDFVLTDAMGFRSGHRYEIAIESAPDNAATGNGGKADVCAKGVITLR